MYKLVRGNLPLLLPVVGAGAAFLLNLFLKANLTAAAYGEFAALLLVVSALFMVGALGFDDVLIRLLEVKTGQVLVRYSLVVAGGVVLCIAPLVSYTLLKVVGVVQDFDVFFLGCSFFVPASMLVGALFKVKGDVAVFYMLNSAWKVILLLLCVCVFYINVGVSYSLFVVVSIVLGFLLSMVFTTRDGIVFQSGGGGSRRILAYMTASFISIVGYAFFDLLDRFVIKEVFTSAEFGDYYFIFTFILSPVGIVAYYFSTKQLARYKLSFDLARFKSDLVRVFSVSLLVALCFAFGIYLAVYFGVVNFVVNYKILLPLVVVLAVVRGSYAIVSMGYAVVCSSRSLMMVGGSFCMLTALLYHFFTTWFGGYDIIYVAALFPCLWCVRLFVYWALISLELKKNCALARAN